MIIDCISDLHGEYPILEGGDLLIVAGDLVVNGGSVFLALWRGCICLCQFNEEENLFFLCIRPGNEGLVAAISNEREGKFTHMILWERPRDY